MALVSPGLEITVTDESQYVSTAVGSVPFVLIATEQDKLFNGAVAQYTTKANAGNLLAVTSQRDLITNFGYPTFQQSSAGTPLNAHPLNEYGLMAAYSALGLCNRMYIIRADVDLKQLEGTAIRPIGPSADGTYWLDLSKSAWGINEWDAVGQGFTNNVPMVLTDPSSYTSIGGILTPNQSVGQIGSYAVVAASPNNYVFYKAGANVPATSPVFNTWQQVGSAGWQQSWPTTVGTVTNPTLTPSNTLNINVGGSTTAVNITASDLNTLVSAINSKNIAGVTAGNLNGFLALYVTNDATNDGVHVNGDLLITNGTGNPLAALGITSGPYTSPKLQYSSYVSIPDWRATDANPAPSGSMWAKTGAIGNGANLVINVYNAANQVWQPVATPIYQNEIDATFNFDQINGGFSITAGTIYIQQDVLTNGTVTYRPFYRQTQGKMSVTGSVPTGSFNPGDSFVLGTSQSGIDVGTDTVVNSALITLTGSTSADFVSAILAANLPEVTAQLEASGAITITQVQGGVITLQHGSGIQLVTGGVSAGSPVNTTGTPLTTAGFTSSTPNIRVLTDSFGTLLASNWAPLVYTYSLTQPYTAPVDGTLWFYNNPLDVDIMINDTGGPGGWQGYRTVSRDARGYNLVNTDPNGPILSALAPTVQSDNTSLAPGDLWINTEQLDKFPVISRWSGSSWSTLTNANTVDQDGIAFADARWDTTGTTDPAAGAFTPISTMLLSNYTDLDCPDHRLYPRGTLLFNLRRSGYNIKKYVNNYFNAIAYPNVSLPTIAATWVSSVTLNADGSTAMGTAAQRNVVIEALKAAIDGSDTIREDSFQFNLTVAPGYPELIPNMVALNNDRKDTSFIIGDTPMDLPADVVSVTNWSTDANGDGLAVADPYMAVYYPSVQTNDLQGNTIICPPSHTILRTAIRSDNVSYPWFAYAGTRRGLVDNATDIGYVDATSGLFVRNGVNQGMRDALYSLNINPITLLPGIGLVNFGNKTRNGTTSALDRVNVARLVNYIRTILAHAGDAFLFEPNDAITRNQFKQMIESVFNDLVTKRGIYDYLVVCDETNNTSDRIARNELYCDIAIEPMKDVEFIYIPIRLLNPGAIASGGK